MGGDRSWRRSENGGDSWSRLAKGLPKKQSYFTILRDGMTIDELKTPAIYFGTTTGDLWASTNEGAKWSCIASHLPHIYAVEAAELRG